MSLQDPPEPEHAWDGVCDVLMWALLLGGLCGIAHLLMS